MNGISPNYEPIYVLELVLLNSTRHYVCNLQYLRRYIHWYPSRSHSFYSLRTSFPLCLPCRVASKVIHFINLLSSWLYYFSWISKRYRSKTCPQCRSRVSEEKTIKLYFQISANQLSQDAGGLENELQNVKFKLTLQNLDIKKLNEENEKAKSQAEGLR